MSDKRWTFCVAPMLDWTTRECRLLHRQFSAHARLYTEMVTTGAIIYGDQARHLRFYEDEHPVALQLGGGDPNDLARAVSLAQPYGYDEINLNVGCPSDRVQNNRIGACLMDDPALVARCLSAMQQESDVPVTVKHRLAIDEQDERDVLAFVDQVASESACRVFIIHARKAWLDGLSPKANRDIPPLNYELVYELKARFPELTIILNGGINSITDAKEHLQYLDGVMLGRAAYQQPELLLDVDTLYGANAHQLSDVLPRLRKQMVEGLANQLPLTYFTRHMLGLFSGRPGARQFRRILSEEARAHDAGIEVWDRAVVAIRNH
ncbi:tRNA dihydrouridine(20/20a) synthase DusA [Suttonella sp. R2A3]|uniref:tRNA dihydrouridine(20/20a) synthase DusA n=1 Tax=Suttonella sp. R2A3 TaxID=2908648 RepID=UPI001F435909|nr:tRNA dihydrouridine(20/20a) synthase DusA [Suttonella sp. R2A3]UJF24842.1 tRNA dihydrouridine(20/20a) synthase DusA [Suttonella sp. R2A3]